MSDRWKRPVKPVMELSAGRPLAALLLLSAKNTSNTRDCSSRACAVAQLLDSLFVCLFVCRQLRWAGPVQGGRREELAFKVVARTLVSGANMFPAALHDSRDTNTQRRLTSDSKVTGTWSASGSQVPVRVQPTGNRGSGDEDSGHWCVSGDRDLGPQCETQNHIQDPQEP